MIKKVCIYCASSKQIAPKYFEAVDQLAKLLVENDTTVVFGGGAIGLMGRLADRVLHHNGRIIGIMPQFMKDVEMEHKQVSEFHFVEDMHERKKKFLEGVDALIALPGGCGTLEELLEAMTLKRLGLFTKPIIILNTDGYYDPLLEMLNRSIQEKFMSEKHGNMWSVVAEPSEVLDAIRHAPPWDDQAINFAAVK